MPNEIKKNEDGSVEVTLESGEVYKGDPFDVMNKMADAQLSTKRWGQNIKAENENLKAQRLNPPEPVQQPPSNGNADELALQNYLLDQQAKAQRRDPRQTKDPGEKEGDDDGGLLRA